MAFTPVKGQTALVKLSMTGGGTDVIVPGVNWKLNQDGKVVDTSNFRDGRAKAPTLEDATLSMTLVLDNADRPMKSTVTAIRTGNTGTAKCYIGSGANDYFSLGVIVQTLGTTNDGVENVLMQDVEFGLTGSITYPADS